MKEIVRDLLGVIGRVINFLFPFRLPHRIYLVFHTGHCGDISVGFVLQKSHNTISFGCSFDVLSALALYLVFLPFSAIH